MGWGGGSSEPPEPPLSPPVHILNQSENLGVIKIAGQVRLSIFTTT